MKLISNQINPNFKLLDSLHALIQVPFCLSRRDLEFSKYFGTSNYRLTNSARTALGIIADVVKPKKRIGIPAFICAVVATPFIERGHEIEWIDVDKNGLLDPQDFESKAAHIDLLVAPHIFGQPLDLSPILSIAQKHNIFVVEDGAHLHTTTLQDDQTGPQPDAKILSFGREKVVSCVSGGALIWPKESPFATKFKDYKLPRASFFWSLRHLLQPTIFTLSEFWWHRGGKSIAWLASILKILPKAVTKIEKHGLEDFPMTQLPVAQQKVLHRQFIQQDQKLRHGIEITKVWMQKIRVSHPYVKLQAPDSRFRLIMTGIKRSQLLADARFQKLHLSEWDGIPISPTGVNLSAFGYQLGQCPKAELYAQNYITFPLHRKIRTRDLEKNL